MYFYTRHFETDEYILLKCCHHINNFGTAYLRAKFHDDIFLQY